MKIQKNKISLRMLLMLLAVIAAPMTALADSVIIGGLYYILNDDNKTAKVTFENENAPGYTNLPANLTIPSSFIYSGNTYTVTEIGYHAFYGCTGLTSVVLPDAVHTIGNRAFQDCTGLTSIDLPGSLITIDAYAFDNCAALTSMNFPSSLAWISTNPFNGCTSLTELICNATTPPTCSGEILKNPQNVTLFVSASVLETYRSTWPWSYFSTIRTIEQRTKIGELCYILNYSTLTAEVADENTTSPRYTSLQGNVVIPETVPCEGKIFSVISIDANAFGDCTGLTSVTVPNSITSIDEAAFSGCTGLTAIAIPESVTSISASTFSGCTGLELIGFHDRLTSIGSSAFAGCIGLTAIAIPESLTSIGASAFSGCTGLTSLEFPDRLTSIGSSAFAGCTGLTYVNIQGSVTEIGGNAFGDCDNLTSVTCNAQTPLHAAARF